MEARAISPRIRRSFPMKMTRIQMLSGALLATTAVTVGATAYSQTMGTVWDSSQLPESRGTVRQYTLTPRGDVDGLILSDGTVLRLPPPEAERLEGWLRPGQMVSARGDVLDTALGKVIDVRAIGSSPEQMTELAGPRPPRGPKGGPDRLGPPPPAPGFAPP